MADEVKISCVMKHNRTDPHERIEKVGGPQPRGSGRWELSLSEAAQGALAGKWVFSCGMLGGA